jgi:hypothetical protein
MINEEKWINSVSKKSLFENNEKNQIDNHRWESTIPKVKKSTSVKKYSILTTVFVCSLIFVSVVKNETRKLEKDINDLKSSINISKKSLHESILEHQVITSPENISKLAKEYLESDFGFYKNSQIKKLNKVVVKYDVDINKDLKKKNKKSFQKTVKNKLVKKIEQRKQDIKAVKGIYSDPKKFKKELKTKVANQIEEKKKTIKSLYDNPRDLKKYTKIQKWAAVQVVKAMLGVPIVPGR